MWNTKISEIENPDKNKTIDGFHKSSFQNLESIMIKKKKKSIQVPQYFPPSYTFGKLLNVIHPSLLVFCYLVLKYRRLHLYVPTTCIKGTCRKYITDAGFHLFLKRLFLNPQSPSKREDKLSLEMAAFESQLKKKRKKSVLYSG